ncbi:MAG: hypothetical protein K0Q65_1514, partial [Clostridia bacterium]|nr:hypothetical protein [Clostridia bacterium]
EELYIQNLEEFGKIRRIINTLFKQYGRGL